VTVAAPTIGAWTLARVLWRTFFLQAAANYERMQNVGVAYALAPVLARLYTGEARAEALKRHLGFYNSHPYLAAAVIGACIRLEVQVARGELPPAMVEGVKRMTMGPLAAIGDSFFWSSLRPFAGAWAAGGLLWGVPWAPLVALALYNGFHLGVRVYGLVVGYQAGEAVITRLTVFQLARYGELAHWGSGAVLGVVAAALADRAVGSPVGVGAPLEPVVVAALTTIFYWCIQRKATHTALLYAGASVLLCYVLAMEWLFPLLGAQPR
jgi:PTS system mannose-specific IID component